MWPIEGYNLNTNSMDTSGINAPAFLSTYKSLRPHGNFPIT